MNNNDAVIEFLLNQLRQQLTNNPYKQQCEDLAHEVLSLKNQLRDASALVAELQKELQHQIDLANGIFRGSTVSFDEKGKVTGIEHWIKSEQSGCRKEDTQECEHPITIALRKGFAPGFTKACLYCGTKLK